VLTERRGLIGARLPTADHWTRCRIPAVTGLIPPLIRQRVIHRQASEAPRHATDSRTPAVGEVNAGGEHDTKLPEAAGFSV
jgi:hypothetical protein